jgi:hypothetical protein
MNWFWQSLITVLLFGTIAGTFLTYYLNKKQEKETQQKIEAAKLATFFAKWIKYDGEELHILNQKELYDYFEELNKMIFELSLWIEDKELLIMIKDKLSHKQDAPDIKDIILKARKLILGEKPDDITVDDIIHFDVPL